MHYKKKGEIAVFLAMLLSILCLFMVRLIDNVKSYVDRSRIMLASDAAIRSCFSEYNKRLYEQFHIMCLDPSYRTNETGCDMLNDHLITYINENIRSGESGGDISDLYVSELYLTRLDRLDDTVLINVISEYEACEAPVYSYACEMFGNYENPRNDSVRRGGIEYLLYGYEDDDLNIGEAVEAYNNYVFPDLYEEGNMCKDEYFLNSGRFLKKSDSNGKFTYSGGTKYNSAVLSYEDYLYMRLKEESEDDILIKIKELINEDLRANGSPVFSLDECVVGIEYIADISRSDGKCISISEAYEY